MDKLHIREAIAVEGKYDKATLTNVTDANIIELGGFRAYHDAELLVLLRRLADSCGLIVLTDSDRAGFQLRGYLSGAVRGAKHAYIPDVYGKEPRKRAPGKEGKLGVEGIAATALRAALEPFALRETTAGEPRPSPLTKADLYTLGLSGGANAAIRRRELCRILGLPQRLSADAFLGVVNALGLERELMREIAPQLRLIPASTGQNS